MIYMMNIPTRSQSFNRRALGFSSPRAHRTLLFSRLLRALIVIVSGVSVISFFLAVGSGYIHVLPSLSQAFQGIGVSVFNGSFDDCDAFDGSWVIDNSYPLYNASECPFVERGFNCLGNGRVDNDYVKWRWKPKNCDIPNFDVHTVLEMFRNKRIVFVGDSMSRTQWESLICLLMTGVEDKSSVYEVNGNNITKQIRFLGVRFSSFNFTVEFFRSVFLVQHNWARKHAPRRVRSTLRLDKLDPISSQWVNSDVLIFNSGQWWVTGKLFGTSGNNIFCPSLHSYPSNCTLDRGCYFEVGKSVKLGMSISTAFRTAIDTWASWVETMIDTNRTHVFFRTFEPSHWSDPKLRLCNVTQQPSLEAGGKDQSLFSDTVMEVVKNMTVPVTVLHVTSMSAFRTDAHVGTWSDNVSLSDCSHWCLPGVPDVWNEIVLSYLLANHRPPLP